VKEIFAFNFEEDVIDFTFSGLTGKSGGDINSNIAVRGMKRGTWKLKVKVVKEFIVPFVFEILNIEILLGKDTFKVRIGEESIKFPNSSLVLI
jgi:hypothetical protein